MKDEQKRQIKCFRCMRIGHHQSKCANDLLCYQCNEFGHMATGYHSHKKLRLFGFGIPEQGFFGIDIPENKIRLLG